MDSWAVYLERPSRGDCRKPGRKHFLKYGRKAGGENIKRDSGSLDEKDIKQLVRSVVDVWDTWMLGHGERTLLLLSLGSWKTFYQPSAGEMRGKGAV